MSDNIKKFFNKYGIYVFLSLLVGMIGGAISAFITGTKTSILADWLSTIGTDTAVVIALLPQIKRLKSSDLIVQVEFDPMNYKTIGSGDVNVKINIFNLKDRNEIVNIDSIEEESKKIIYGEKQNNKLDAALGDNETGALIHDLSELMNTDDKSGNKVDPSLSPLIIKGESQVKNINKEIFIPLNSIGTYTHTITNEGISYKPCNVYSVTLIKMHAHTNRDKDNYWFYVIVISYLNNHVNKNYVYKNERFKNKLNEETFNKQINNVLGEITTATIKNLN